MTPAHDADHVLFERLCLLRSLYAHRGDLDRQGVISTIEVMREAQARLEEPNRSSPSPAA